MYVSYNFSYMITIIIDYLVNVAFFQIRLSPIANCEEWAVSY